MSQISQLGVQPIRIAAGEVIERPAMVMNWLKTRSMLELGQIVVEIEEAGLKSIRYR